MLVTTSGAGAGSGELIRVSTGVWTSLATAAWSGVGVYACMATVGTGAAGLGDLALGACTGLGGREVCMAAGGGGCWEWMLR